MEFQTARLEFLLDSETILILAYRRDGKAIESEIADVISEVCRSAAQFLSIRQTVEKNLSQTNYIITLDITIASQNITC